MKVTKEDLKYLVVILNHKISSLESDLRFKDEQISIYKDLVSMYKLNFDKNNK